jgi:hypothetical protein
MKNRGNAVFEIKRTKKSGNFTILDNGLLLDTRLSAKARLIMAIVISLPNSWDFNIAGIGKISGQSENIVRNALAELENCGYLVRSRLRDKNGKLGSAVYSFYEMPRGAGKDAEAAVSKAVPKAEPKPDAAPKSFGKSGMARKGKVFNYTPRKWNYDYLEMMERARLFSDLGREEEGELWRGKARELK